MVSGEGRTCYRVLVDSEVAAAAALPGALEVKAAKGARPHMPLGQTNGRGAYWRRRGQLEGQAGVWLVLAPGASGGREEESGCAREGGGGQRAGAGAGARGSGQERGERAGAGARGSEESARRTVARVRERAGGKRERAGGSVRAGGREGGRRGQRERWHLIVYSGCRRRPQRTAAWAQGLGEDGGGGGRAKQREANAADESRKPHLPGAAGAMTAEPRRYFLGEKPYVCRVYTASLRGSGGWEGGGRKEVKAGVAPPRLYPSGRIRHQSDTPPSCSLFHSRPHLKIKMATCRLTHSVFSTPILSQPRSPVASHSHYNSYPGR